MKTIGRAAILAALVLLWPGVRAVAWESEYSGPGRLSQLMSESDFIVVASCVRTQSVQTLVYTLEFDVRKPLKGDLTSFTLQLNERGSPVFDIVTAPHPFLVFLKRGADGKPDLTSFQSAVALDARDASLPAVISKELEINALPAGSARRAALRRFILPLLATGGESYTQESLAEDMLDLCANRSVRLSPPELALVFHTATNTDSYKVALPLALVLAQQDAPQADAACLHVLLDTDALAQDHWFRLAPALAKRPSLRESFIQKTEQTRDIRRVGLMVTQLYQVEPAALDAIYERLWRNNPSAHADIQRVLQQSSTPAHDALLRRLTSQNAQ